MRSVFMGSRRLSGEVLNYHLLIEEVEDLGENYGVLLEGFGQTGGHSRHHGGPEPGAVAAGTTAARRGDTGRPAGCGGGLAADVRCGSGLAVPESPLLQFCAGSRYNKTTTTKSATGRD